MPCCVRSRPRVVILMPDIAPGIARHRSTAARPAEKGITEKHQVDPVALRMAVNGWVALTGQRRKQARAVVLAYVSEHGPDLDGWAHWLKNWHGISDPTGEAVARRLGGGRVAE